MANLVIVRNTHRLLLELILISPTVEVWIRLKIQYQRILLMQDPQAYGRAEFNLNRMCQPDQDKNLVTVF